MTLSMKEFVQQVKNEVEFRFDSYSYTQDSKDWSFAQWVLELLFPSIDSDQAFNSLANSADDTWNINASYRDNESGTFFILCARYSDSPDESDLGPGLIYSLLDLYKKVTDDTANLTLSGSVLTDAAQATAEGYGLSIILASLGSLDDSINLNEVRKTYGLDEQQFIHYDLHQLRRVYAGLDEEDEPQPVTLTFESYTEGVGPVEAVVGNLAASELAEAFRALVPQVYDVNLRAPLRSTKINKQIKETLLSRRRRFFWYYNNGITVLCRGFYAEPDKPETFVVDSPRIVNGAQTTDTILSASDEELEGVNLMVRIIAALPGSNQVADDMLDQPDLLQDLYLDIARYTNSQNPIEMPDFRSNEEVQRRLQEKFANLGWFYERRRGQWANYSNHETFKNGHKAKRIRMVDLAQRWFAFDGNPAIAIREKLSLFEEQGHYGSIFMLVRSAEEYLLAYLIFEHVQERLKENIKRAREEEQRARETATRVSLVTRNYLMIGRATKLATAHMTALLGLALRDKYGPLDRDLAQKLLRVTESGELVKRAYSELEDTLFRVGGQLQQEQHKTLHRFLSERDTLVELYDVFSYVLEREREKGRDVLTVNST